MNIIKNLLPYLLSLNNVRCKQCNVKLRKSYVCQRDNCALKKKLDVILLNFDTWETPKFEIKTVIQSKPSHKINNFDWPEDVFC